MLIVEKKFYLKKMPHAKHVFVENFSKTSEIFTFHL